MLAGSTRRVLKVFLASPGDLGEERKITRDVVGNLNKSLRKLDIYIELLGWEDTLPGVGRPQARINSDVDECDLFIGLMWKRWGSQTGEYSSGFEEEFNRALKRNKKEGKPEIWLAFKEVDTELLRDPGEQLQKVLAFKQRQVENREVLFKEFINSPDWQMQLFTWLFSHVSGLITPESQSQIASIAISRVSPSESLAKTEGATSEGRTDIAQLTSRLEKSLLPVIVSGLSSIFKDSDIARLALDAAINAQPPLEGVALTQTQGDGYTTFTLTTNTSLTAAYLRFPGTGLAVNSPDCVVKEGAVECTLEPAESKQYAITRKFQVSIAGRLQIPKDRLVGLVCTDRCHKLYLEADSEGQA